MTTTNFIDANNMSYEDMKDAALEAEQGTSVDFKVGTLISGEPAIVTFYHGFDEDGDSIIEWGGTNFEDCDASDTEEQDAVKNYEIEKLIDAYRESNDESMRTIIREVGGDNVHEINFCGEAYFFFKDESKFIADLKSSITYSDEEE